MPTLAAIAGYQPATSPPVPAPLGAAVAERLAYDSRALLRAYSGDALATTLRNLSRPPVPPDILGRFDSALRGVNEQSALLISSIQKATASAAHRELMDMPKALDAMLGRIARDAPICAGAQVMAIDFAKLTRDPLAGMGVQQMTSALVKAISGLPPQMLSSAVGTAPIMPFPMPAIHIRREREPSVFPRSIPCEDDQWPPVRGEEDRRPSGYGTRRIGRPPHSYLCTPEFVVMTYQRLAESGRYVTQEALAIALNIKLRTLQGWLTPEKMGLGWPPRL
jgi:hypothetical protein